MVTTTVQDAIDRSEDVPTTDPSEATPGTKVDVYRNLQKGGLSIRSRETETYGLVIDHRKGVVLEDVEFVVREKGRQKVLDEGVKNVHAVARGIISEEMEVDSEAIEVTYNPYKYDSFVSKQDERPINTASLVFLTQDGVFAHGVTYDD